METPNRAHVENFHISDILRRELVLTNSNSRLYNSSIAYGMRHALMAEKQRSETHIKIQHIEEYFTPKLDADIRAIL